MKSKKQIQAKLCDIMSTLAETEENSIDFDILIQKKELLEDILNETLTIDSILISFKKSKEFYLENKYFNQIVYAIHKGDTKEEVILTLLETIKDLINEKSE